MYGIKFQGIMIFRSKIDLEEDYISNLAHRAIQNLKENEAVQALIEPDITDCKVYDDDGDEPYVPAGRILIDAYSEPEFLGVLEDE